ncbi:MAG: LuxR C-terminal-related transcriptional regulator [Leptolyngbyaceae bacterium]|nr:LuxR C-terminal-related transcriptional regulator [Leptolyngbyaceae bacterium]
MLNTKTQTKQEPPTLVVLPPLAPLPEYADTSPLNPLATVFETLLDHLFPFQGFMLLDGEGNLVHCSPRAKHFCSGVRIESNDRDNHPSRKHSLTELPETIKHLAECLIESRELFQNQHIQLQDVVVLNEMTPLQLQLHARWVHLGPQRHPFIVVTFENLTESVHQQALIDAQQYQLTDRETEVWELHLRGFTYRQMAEKLYISVNTVKRHMKSIHSKRKYDYFDLDSSA